MEKKIAGLVRLRCITAFLESLLYAIYTPYMTDYIFQEYYRQYEKDFAASDYLAN
ncbi:MAG: hypothetical protein ACLRZ6_07835 [Lachnospiraceae bacterium]